MVVLNILGAVMLAVIGQLLVKHGIDLRHDVAFSNGLIHGFVSVFTSPWVIAGSLVYGFSVFFWVYALSQVDLSYAYPFVSLSYIFIILSSRFLFGEFVSPLRWLGVAVICLGILIVSRT